MAANELSNETSPYLLQHKDNPVAWLPWGDTAFSRSKAENKPILLSVGYAACHWCHVMAHESFESEATAKIMNDLFIPVKVDREERPDVDAIYQTALALMGQQGGWPLTMFLAPNGEPFWGGTYFPDSPRYGRPSFEQILHRVHEVYQTQPEDIAKNQKAIVESLTNLWSANDEDQPFTLNLGILHQVTDHLIKQMDMQMGGLSGAPKFPHTPLLELLWRRFLRDGSEEMQKAVLTAVENMAQGGIYDHLGGGYARYSTDERWLAPHFEKMLYDNAQIIDINLDVWCATKSELLKRRTYETVDWLFREMIAEGGAFAATLDADSEGVEGKFYVWDEAEIDNHLGTEAGFFKQYYDISEAGNWEHVNILNRLNSMDLLSDPEENRLAGCRDTLFRERALRIRPGWDDKVLADWNGLMIHAIARAGATFGEESWISAATKAFSFVQTQMQDPEHGPNRLMHSHRTGKNTAMGMLDDYAALCRAALTLYDVTGDKSYITHCENWLGVLEDHFLDADHGGYYFTADDAENLIVRQKSAADNATPAGNGLLVTTFARLFWLTGKTVYRDRLERLLDSFSPELQRNFFPLTSYLNGLELYLDPVQVIIVGDRTEQDCQDFIKTVRQSGNLNIILDVISDPTTLSETHPAHGKPTQPDGKTVVYVCRGMSCSLPIDNPANLSLAITPEGIKNIF